MGHEHSAIVQTRVSGKQMRLPNSVVSGLKGNRHAKIGSNGLAANGGAQIWHDFCH